LSIISILQKKQNVKNLSQKKNADNIFESVEREWHENKKEHWNERYEKEVIKRLEDNIFPLLGEYPINDFHRLSFAFPRKHFESATFKTLIRSSNTIKIATSFDVKR
jgi:integrase